MHWSERSLARRRILLLSTLITFLALLRISQAKVDIRFDIISDEQYDLLRQALLGDQGVLSQKWGNKDAVNAFTNCRDPSLENLHAGVDYAADLRIPIFSGTTGQVTEVQQGADCQNLECLSIVRIFSPTDFLPKKTIVYLHLIPDPKIAVGQTVTKGQTIIGTVARRGTKVPHLHFQVNLRGTPTSCIDGTLNPYQAVFFIPTNDMVPLALIGQPAPGGGTFSSFASFSSLNNRGDLVFNAEVNPTGSGNFRFSAGQFSKMEVPGIPGAGAFKFNNVGDMAFAAGNPNGVYFLRAGSSTPIKIAQEGQGSPIPRTIYYLIEGPLAFNDQGEVTFSAGLRDLTTQTGTCCYLFLYSPTDGSVVKVVGNDDPTPIGGTFLISAGGVNQFTSDGDIVFNAEMNGGPTRFGIFLFSRTTLGFRKIVVKGDRAPAQTGGTLGAPFTSHHFVSGRRLVFQAGILGGTSDQAIFVKDDVRSDTDPRVIAFAGQSTGTEVGGEFAEPVPVATCPDSPSALNCPFSPLGDLPHIRADGGVVFITHLRNAFTADHVPTSRGIFLWTGREFRKIVVEGDRLPSGQTMSGASAYIMNDIGQVYYFIAEIH